MLQTALIVEVPEAAELVDPWREQTCSDKPSIGIPAHVTLLFPFVPADEIDGLLIGELRAFFASRDGWGFRLPRSGRFPELLYLAPEPAEPFRRLTEAIFERYPGYPPYEGAHETIIPHLTVGYGEPALLDEMEIEVGRGLPIEAEAREVVLLEEIVPDWGKWEARERFPLG